MFKANEIQILLKLFPPAQKLAMFAHLVCLHNLLPAQATSRNLGCLPQLLWGNTQLKCAYVKTSNESSSAAKQHLCVVDQRQLEFVMQKEVSPYNCPCSPSQPTSCFPILHLLTLIGQPNSQFCNTDPSQETLYKLPKTELEAGKNTKFRSYQLKRH